MGRRGRDCEFKYRSGRGACTTLWDKVGYSG